MLFLFIKCKMKNIIWSVRNEIFEIYFNIGFKFEVTESYVELLGQWGMLIMSFYFGGRTVEKVSQIVKGKNNDR